MILTALCEGNSVSATARMTGASKVTVLRLLADAGTLAAQYHDLYVRDIEPSSIQVDELWSFVGCKERTKATKGGKGHGDAWVWVAIDSDTKLVISYLVADRSGLAARMFMDDVADRVVGRVQLTSDGLA
ncbi:hypothetical protein [Mucisphaera calidilacus]|nr:hypothetical protein [Mucisphaera calidilacus]